MGRKWLIMSLGGRTLGRGEIRESFHCEGTTAVENEVLIMQQRGAAKRSASDL